MFFDLVFIEFVSEVFYFVERWGGKDNYQSVGFSFGKIECRDIFFSNKRKL